MPSVPEVRNGNSLIGRIKIHRKPDPYHSSDPLCHIAVSAEIKVDLQRIADHHNYRICAAKLRHIRIACIYKLCQIVCKQDLFGKAQRKAIKSFPQIFKAYRPSALCKKRNGKLLTAGDRPLEHLGEKQIIGCKLKRGIPLIPLLVAVYQVHQMLERIKADADRHKYLHHRNRASQNSIYIFHQKNRILKEKQHSDIKSDTDHQDQLSDPLLFRLCDPSGNSVICRHACCKHQKRSQPLGSQKPQGKQIQHPNSGLTVPVSACKEIAKHKKRQKEKYK